MGAQAAGLGLRAVARVCAVAPTTVLAWLVEVADHAAACARYCRHDVRGTPGQLDERLALLSAVKPGAVNEAEAMTRLARASHGLWATIAPVTTRLLTSEGGDRTRAMAQRGGQQGVQGVAPGWVPLFFTDGFKAYTPALRPH